ncbi:hypothetical protein ABT160_19740 [Streptomyces sp. NPDC001941]|uniref:hypothetical protein n=1 Tax=Streptomyces sp. NPDC001941 TaxID=3154659 RepID=UPI003317CA55
MNPRRFLGALVLSAVLAGAAGCSDGDVDKAKDKVRDVAASATAAAASKMAEVKDGADGKADVTAGATRADGDRTAVTVTAKNSTAKAADYAVLVNFRDGGGNLLDSVVLNIGDVAPSASKEGTARSNRSLSGDITAEIGRALRH